jgi:hypothetical protein
MPGGIAKKAQVLKFIEKEIHADYLIVEMDDDEEGTLTITPFTGVVPDAMKDGLGEMPWDDPETDQNA